MGDIVHISEHSRPGVNKTTSAVRADSPDPEIADLGRRSPGPAFAILVEKYRRALYRHSFHMLSNPEDAYDITQEVFLRAYNEKRLFQQGFHIRGWLYRVTTNLSLKKIRHNKVRSLFRLRKLQESNNPSQDLLPVAQAIAGETRKDVMNAIDLLSPRFRALILLRYYEGFSYKEISETLRTPMGSVMSGLSRARIQLNKLLAPLLQDNRESS